jgi:Uma2 family endonuclease
MGTPVQNRRYTIAEYLKLERDAQEKHEFHEGEILAKPAESLEHSLISANITGEAGNALKRKTCRVANSNLRVRIPRMGRYVYPDALVFCGPPQFDPDDTQRHTIVNPRVIIEVLSTSTEAYDRGDKFALYREIDSFEEYILISQDRPNVESWLRQSDRAWSILNVTGLESTAGIRCLGIQIPLAEIYAGVDWPTPPAGKQADAV